MLKFFSFNFQLEFLTDQTNSAHVPVCKTVIRILANELRPAHFQHLRVNRLHHAILELDERRVEIGVHVTKKKNYHARQSHIPSKDHH